MLISLDDDCAAFDLVAAHNLPITQSCVTRKFAYREFVAFVLGLRERKKLAATNYPIRRGPAVSG